MKTFRFLFLGGLVVWILGEILTRFLLPIDPFHKTIDRSLEHPYLRNDWVPGFQTTYVIDGIAGQTGTMDFRINEFGFRSSSMKTAEKPAGTLRIFFLGGSTTESVYLPEEKTFPFLVEKELARAFPDKKFEAVNGGISGYLAADLLATLVYKVLYYHPDIVVVMPAAINDLRYGTVPTYDPVRRPDYRKILYRPGYKDSAAELLAKFFKRSHFLTLIKWRIFNRFFPPEAEKYRTKLEQYDAFRKKRRETAVSESSESKALPDFIKYLEEVIFTAQGHGIRLILMTEPFVYQHPMPPEIEDKLWMGWMGLNTEAPVNLSNDFLLHEMNRFNDAVRELAQKYGVELVDLERDIPKDLEHFYDDVHFTPAGARKAAEVISSYLTRRP